ncbi:MAG TPA: methyltransferase domain-containing protein [Clostridia bacterium]
MGGKYIEFYGKNCISPVRQDISDLARHFERREGLYRQLGIFPLSVEGKSILEIGPGSGYNSIYTASLSPSLYHLVEENPTGIREMEELFEQYSKWTYNTEIFKTRIEDFNNSIKYDIVLCEGMLPQITNSIEILNIIKQFVKPGGILVITCIDSISGASENLRYLIGNLMVWELDDINKMLDILVPVFSPHLETLKGMSRRHDDWVMDNIINPLGVAETLSIAKTVEELSDEFEAYASSPGIFCDWRWYKSICGETKSFNQTAVNQYWCQVHNLLDYRSLYPPREESQNKKMYFLFEQLRKNIKELVDHRDIALLKQITIDIKEIINSLESISHELALPFIEALDILLQDKIYPAQVINSKNFKSFFGRGQQYLSLIRNL